MFGGIKTGRDGIHGASMASAEFDENLKTKNPQYKLVIHLLKNYFSISLRANERDPIIAIQDMGAAGLTSSSVEMASKGSLGIELNLEKVPCREENMTPIWDDAIRKSRKNVNNFGRAKKNTQEKFDKWDLDFVVIGKTTNTKNLTLKFHNKT